jgi:hypothetical protein
MKPKILSKIMLAAAMLITGLSFCESSTLPVCAQQQLIAQADPSAQVIICFRMCQRTTDVDKQAVISYCTQQGLSQAQFKPNGYECTAQGTCADMMRIMNSQLYVAQLTLSNQMILAYRFDPLPTNPPELKNKARFAYVAEVPGASTGTNSGGGTGTNSGTNGTFSGESPLGNGPGTQAGTGQGGSQSGTGQGGNQSGSGQQPGTNQLGNQSGNPAFNPNAPAYNPNAPAFNPNSPAYNPSTSTFDPNGPAYIPNTTTSNTNTMMPNTSAPAYNPNAPAYNPNLPANTTSAPTYSSNVPAYNPNAPTIPNPPTFKPSTPAFIPNPPASKPNGGK